MAKLLRKRIKKLASTPSENLQSLVDSSFESTSISLLTIEDHQTNFQENISIEDLSKTDFLLEKKRYWLHCTGLLNVDLLNHLLAQFDLNPLHISDVFNIDHPPKFEEWDDSYFFLAKSIQIEENQNQHSISYNHVGIFLLDNIIISICQKKDATFSSLISKLKRSSQHSKINQENHILYYLLESINSTYYHVVENLGTKVDKLELEVIQNPTQKILRDINQLKIDFLDVAKIQAPFKDVIQSYNGTDHQMPEEFKPFFRDALDHANQVYYTIKNYRETLSNMLEIYMSFISLKTNDTMRFLTVFSAIFIPINFITGLFGMNFRFIPALENQWGFYFALAAMILISGGLIFYFLKKKWINLS